MSKFEQIRFQKSWALTQRSALALQTRNPWQWFNTRTSAVSYCFLRASISLIHVDPLSSSWHQPTPWKVVALILQIYNGELEPTKEVRSLQNQQDITLWMFMNVLGQNKHVGHLANQTTNYPWTVETRKKMRNVLYFEYHHHDISRHTFGHISWHLA